MAFFCLLKFVYFIKKHSDKKTFYEVCRMEFQSINPTNSELLAQFPEITTDELESTIQSLHTAFKQWKQISFAERGKHFILLSRLLKEHADALAELASIEMGKIHSEAKAEILKSASACEYYAEHSESILKPIIAYTGDDMHVEYHYQPKGIILGIFPWNFPFWQILRSLIPTLMSGNVMLIKPAPNVPQCSLRLQELINQAGLSQVCKTVFIHNETIQTILADNRIQGVNVTGSERAGSAVAQQASAHIKSIVLELGGSDPFIVLADADLIPCVNTAVLSRYQNNGQSCIAAKRFIVHRSIADEFIRTLTHAVQQLKCGDPLDASTHIGPLARLDLYENVKRQVDESCALGARILYQQTQIPEQGYFYPPTILTDITQTMPAYNEELFGPVLSLFIVDTNEEAINIANDTQFGLGASIWSKNIKKAKEIALKIESGSVFINRLVRSDVRFSFGGTKRSGIGHELGEEGLKSFCTKKTIQINP